MSKRSRNHNTFSFAELRAKEVINSIDGKRFGRIIDIVFGTRDGKILGLVVPPVRKNIIFRNNEPIFLPWESVEKIGEDIILVCIMQYSQDRPNRERVGERVRINSVELDEQDEEVFQKQTSVEVMQKSRSTTTDQDKSNERDQNSQSRQSRHEDSISMSVPDVSSPHFRPGIDCDNKCSKCMLFDCSYRWNSSSL
ncbi:MAG: YlmC/YmxH family sporulation protein [Firmicutes bacterium]|nr:YlmC/YmxH family sporulation protein [Bacillota bacterium]MCL1954015.1 YlmC/YmxH family sporulation protein [Bacillota bacterium]